MRLPKEPPKRGKFCELMTTARGTNFPGWWEGSAYRCHPVGVIRQPLVLANHWNVNNYCHVSVFTDWDGGINFWGDHPAFHGDPFPHPKRGEEIKVYCDGNWCYPEGPWRDGIWQILFDIEIWAEQWGIEFEWVQALRAINRKNAEQRQLEQLRGMYR